MVGLNFENPSRADDLVSAGERGRRKREMLLLLRLATSLGEGALHYTLVDRVMASLKDFGTIFAFSPAEHLEKLIAA